MAKYIATYTGKSTITGTNKTGNEVFLTKGQKGQIVDLAERTLSVKVDYRTGKTTTFATRFQTENGVFKMVPILNLE